MGLVITVNKKFVDLYGIIAMAIIMLMALVPNVSAQAEAMWIGGVICTIYIIMFIIWIAVAIWVYKDAEKRGQSGVLWLLVVLIGSIIGLVVYLLVRSGFSQRPPYPGYPPMGGPCPRCGSPLTFVPQYNRWFCNFCRQYM